MTTRPIGEITKGVFVKPHHVPEGVSSNRRNRTVHIGDEIDAIVERIDLSRSSEK